jgi:large subunit ribosomal protein L30
MKVKVTQIKSGIGRPANQKRTLASLGLKKIRQSRVHELTAPIQGMIAKVSHLVEVEEIN